MQTSDVQKLKCPQHNHWVKQLTHGCRVRCALFHLCCSPANGSADKGDGKLICAQTMTLIYTIVMNIFHLVSPPHCFHSAHLHFPIWWLWKIPLCAEKDRKFSFLRWGGETFACFSLSLSSSADHIWKGSDLGKRESVQALGVCNWHGMSNRSLWGGGTQEKLFLWTPWLL